jgi:hypothetical protein
MIKRIAACLGVATAVVLGASLSVAVAPPAAQASTACPVTITHPNINIRQDSQYQSYSLPQTCNTVDAAWEVVGPYNWDDGSLFYPGGLSMTYYAWFEGSHLGQYTLVALGAFDSSNNPLPQASETFYVRFASGVVFSGYRTGSYVHVRAYVRRYQRNLNYGAGGWQQSVGRSVTFQQSWNGGWQNKATRTTGTDGWTGYVTLAAGAHHYYRAKVAATSTLGDAVSAQMWL